MCERIGKKKNEQPQPISRQTDKKKKLCPKKSSAKTPGPKPSPSPLIDPTARGATRDPSGSCEGGGGREGVAVATPPGGARGCEGLRLWVARVRGRGGCERGRKAPLRSRGVESLPRDLSQPQAPCDPPGLLATPRGSRASLTPRDPSRPLATPRDPSRPHEGEHETVSERDGE